MLGLVEFAGNPPRRSDDAAAGISADIAHALTDPLASLQFRIVGSDVEHVVESVEELRRRHGRW